MEELRIPSIEELQGQLKELGDRRNQAFQIVQQCDGLIPRIQGQLDILMALEKKDKGTVDYGDKGKKGKV